MKKIIYCSQFSDSSGYAVAARNYLLSLDKVLEEYNNIELKVYDLSCESKFFLNEASKNLIKKYSFNSYEEILEYIKQDYTCLWHYPSGFLELCSKYKGEKKWDFLDLIIKKSKKNINYVTWEADKIPSNWNDIYREYKTYKILTSSEWNKSVFQNSVEIPVDILYHSIQQSIVEQNTPIKQLEEEIKNKFVIFSMSQWQNRKGFDKLIQSYLMEFKNQEDVVLIIKTYGNLLLDYENTKKMQMNSIKNEIESYKSSVYLDNCSFPKAKIIALCDVLPYEKISWLYSKSNIFALLTRGEGFGLTIAEAIMHKKPVLVTEGSGHMDLVDKKNCFLVKSYLHPFINKPEYNSDMNWLEPDFLSARNELRKSYDLWKKNNKKLENMGNCLYDNLTSLGLDSISIGKKMISALELI